MPEEQEGRPKGYDPRRFINEGDMIARDAPHLLIGREAYIQRFRPWYVRWFRRLNGHWQPRVKWEVERSGTITGFDGHRFTLR